MTSQSDKPTAQDKINVSIEEVRAQGFSCFQEYWDAVLTPEDEAELEKLYPPPLRVNSLHGGVPQYVEPDGWSRHGDFD